MGGPLHPLTSATLRAEARLGRCPRLCASTTPGRVETTDDQLK
jgi:hypothetical protein